MVIVVFIVGGLISFLRLGYLEQGVPKYDISTWVEQNKIEKVLIVFAHQDDELLVSGSLAGLNAAGIKTSLLTLTNGDGERRSESVSIESLIKERKKELEAVAELLGIDTLEQGFFSDQGFMDVTDSEIKPIILERIRSFHPDTIITWDTEKGLYGHPHHVRVARLAIEICNENKMDPAFPVKAVYSSTVSVWIREALKKLSPMYQRRYYEISKGESIEPTFSLATSEFADYRRSAFAVYVKRGAVQGLNPLSGAPKVIEDFVFDREYFYQSY